MKTMIQKKHAIKFFVLQIGKMLVNLAKAVSFLLAFLQISAT